MQCKESYPEDFKDAFRRSPLKEGELDELVARSSYPPVFVFGHSMLPTALKYFADIPQAMKVDMVYATLPGYKLHHFAEEGKPGLPTIKPSLSPAEVVEGMLVFGLTREQRSDIQEIECVRTGHSMFMAVHVQVSLMDRIHGFEVKCQKTVDAGTFVWAWNSKDTELLPMETSFWPIDEFLNGQLYANIVDQQNKLQVSDD
ncbi:gamma-glutamylcyclotransferase family protein [Aspergillus mulundensis]|uniref:Gamma-glutamylcyclotransferase AIG2-like domain-containing protein n=1 Tax=Aspergillus mulundensis TaxID=1810919 RepID=A0A3D8RYL2_9EURO|nr:Uncharacterized protein DSM5745_06005 [Aspergillus mulundensis]RDW79153.1 Uncharacterized protein DSM5745_06005 [Aspergillus mulundensis]